MLRLAFARASEDQALARGEAPEGLLSRIETAELATLQFPRRRLKWLLGRVAAKRVIGETFRAEVAGAPSAAEIVIANEPSGAPFAVIGGVRWLRSLSISHREDVAIAAAATRAGVSIGIDLEAIAPRDPALIRQFFTDAEAERVRRAGADRDLLVTRIWSAKESILKVLRVGLRMDTRAIEIGEELEGAGSTGPAGFLALAAHVRGVPIAVGHCLLDGWVVTCAYRGANDPPIDVS